MRKVCLDSDFLVALLRGSREAAEKAEQYDGEGLQIATTAMNAFEIYLGAYRSASAIKNLRESDNLLTSFQTLHLTRESARKSSEIMDRLLRAGQEMGLRDAIVAGIALTEGYALVTRNATHFERVAGLTVEGW